MCSTYVLIGHDTNQHRRTRHAPRGSPQVCPARDPHGPSGHRQLRQLPCDVYLADRLGCFEVTGGRFSGELHLQSVFGWRKLWTYRGEQLR